MTISSHKSLSLRHSELSIIYLINITTNPLTTTPIPSNYLNLIGIPKGIRLYIINSIKSWQMKEPCSEMKPILKSVNIYQLIFRKRKNNRVILGQWSSEPMFR